MKTKHLTVLLFAASSTCFGQSIVNDVVSSSGDSFSNSTHQVDFTLGELSTTTHTSGQNQLSEGFHQGNYDVSTLLNEENQTISVSVFPNPSADIVNIGTANSASDVFLIQLFDLSGKIIVEKTSTSQNTQIDISKLAAGTYPLAVFNNNKAIYTSKITKK